MQFGIGLIDCQRYPGDPRRDADLYAEALALAEHAEATGWDSVWTTEHHFFDSAYMPSVLPVCAAMAARTERITVGTACLLSALYDPLRLAEDAATVDLLSNGRFALGVAQGWRSAEFDALGVPFRGRHMRFEDTVTVLREAWSDGLVRGGETVAYPGVSVQPKPASPGGPPIWIGAMGEPAVRRAARVGDGFLCSLVTRELTATATPDASSSREERVRGERQFGLETLRERVRWIREELEREGRDPDGFRFALILATLAADDPDAAWERVRDHYHYCFWKYDDMAGEVGRTGLRPRPQPALTAAYEEELRASMLLGTPEHVAEQLAACRELCGDELHFIARMYWPGLDAGYQRETLDVFAEQVMPRLA